MKKTVSINIGGIIFHIEEDGFEKLKSYLGSVNKYFSSFEDSKEIIADIEARIAEIFLSKLTATRQTISIEDVDDLIKIMGTTQDFDATLEAEPEVSKSEHRDEKQGTDEKGEQASSSTRKRLYRDVRRRLIGGVSAGIAHYFSIDPLWIRLLFIALFVNVLFTGISGITLLAYIVLWIVLPHNSELEEDTRIKKLFRNPDSRVLGGVSGGIAAYFGIDVSIVRLLFVVSIFLGGAGILVYIILWIITPEAKTVTEKVQMEGEPVTLKNIEESVKRNLKVKEGEEEGALVKILLFPFRLIAMIIQGLAKAFGPLLGFLVDALRVVFGAIVMLNGFTFMLAFTGLLLVIYGVGGMSHLYQLGEIPVDLLRNSLDTLVVFGIWAFGLISALAVFLLGLSIVLKRRVVNSYIGWSLFVLWLLSAVLTAYSLPGYAAEFAADDNYRIEETYEQTEQIPLLKLSDESVYDVDLVDLRLRGHRDSLYKLVVDIESRGTTRSEAIANAKQVVYHVEKQGNVFLFDPKVTFPEGAKFRFQHVNATLYIPEGQVFRMDRELNSILENTLYLGGYRSSQMENNDWIFKDGVIVCITCQKDQSVPGGKVDRNNEEMTYPFEDFDQVKVGSLMEVEIRQGSEYKVSVRGHDDDLDEVYLNQVGDELEVKFKEENWEWWSDNKKRNTKLYITMPKLEYLELVGKCKGSVGGFDEEDLEVQLVGASDLFLESNVKRMEISIAGASEMVLKGKGDELNVDIVGASKLEAFDFKVRNATLEVIGASKAEVNVMESLDVEAAGMSKVKYRGDARVSINEVGLSTVEKD